MSEMAPEQPAGGGNFLTQRIMGLPVIVWVGVVALGAYLFITHRGSSSANGAVSESGGGGSARTGNTTIDKGAIQVTITQSNPQPKPPTTHKHKTEHKPSHHSPPHKVTPPHIVKGPIPPPKRGGGGRVHPGTPPRKKGAPHPDRKPAVHRATHKLKRS